MCTYVWATNHKSIIVDGSIGRYFQGGMSGASTYVYNGIVCFNFFLKVGVYCIVYMCFQKTDVYKMGSCYCKLKTKTEVGSLWKFSEYYTIGISVLSIETVNS
jgi:hypothetical protein